MFEGAQPEERGRPAREAPRPAVKTYQDKLKVAAKTYLGKGKTAVGQDWSEF